MAMNRAGLQKARDGLHADLKRRHVKGVRSVAIGGRRGQNVLIVALSGPDCGGIPRDFDGIKVEVEDVGNLERY